MADRLLPTFSRQAPKNAARRDTATRRQRLYFFRHISRRAQARKRTAAQCGIRASSCLLWRKTHAAEQEKKKPIYLTLLLSIASCAGARARRYQPSSRAIPRRAATTVRTRRHRPRDAARRAAEDERRAGSGTAYAAQRESAARHLRIILLPSPHSTRLFVEEEPLRRGMASGRWACGARCKPAQTYAAAA